MIKSEQKNNLIVWLVEHGVLPEELPELKFSDFDNGKLIVGNGREIEFDKEGTVILADYVEAIKGNLREYVFTTPGGLKQELTGIRMGLTKHLKRQGKSLADIGWSVGKEPMFKNKEDVNEVFGMIAKLRGLS